MLIFEGSMWLAARNDFHTARLVDCTPIVLPIMAWGSLSGLLASDMMANGFFWYWAPTITSGAPLATAGPVISGEEIPTKALPAATTASCATAGPPEMSLTSLNPAAV
jgi:hypothetical protein